MSIYALIIQYLSEKEELYTTEASMRLILAIIWIGLIISIFISVLIYKRSRFAETFNEMIRPILNISLLMSLRFVFSLIDYYVWYYSSGEYSLIGVFENSTDIGIFYFNLVLLENRNLVRIPRNREDRFRSVVLFFKISLLIGLVLTLINEVFMNTGIVGTLLYVIIIGLLMVILFVFRREVQDNSSKIIKVRLTLMSQGLLAFIGYLLTFVFGYSYMAFTYPDGNIPSAIIISINFGLVLFPVLWQLWFYWALAIPAWARKRYHLFSPRLIQKDLKQDKRTE